MFKKTVLVNFTDDLMLDIKMNDLEICMINHEHYLEIHREHQLPPQIPLEIFSYCPVGAGPLFVLHCYSAHPWSRPGT